ncbi:MAG: crossover junction endodeoxyribonuclease RuvC [Candidatus Pacebacteria bacterium]|nr:crossover junction endodeoxyribonuclease RuvC [Candidatus Paceibacterota bacterium]
MTILSIDPGYERVGISILEKTNNKEKLIYSDCFKTSAELPFLERLKKISDEVERIIKKYKPGVLAIEKLFFNTNQKTATRVSEVRGALLYIAKVNKMDVYEYTPLQIKVATTGNGHGDKKQVIAMVKNLIPIDKEIEHDDEFDAIAVGLTCIASERNLI